MRTLKACIFDLDGVIVDTAKYHFLAWRQIADDLRFTFTEKDNERLKGVSRMRSLEILLEVGGISADEGTKEHLAERKNNLYLEYIMKMGKDEILPGVMNFLKALKQNDIKIALGSASKNAPLILSRLGLEQMFDTVIDGSKVSRAKPDPEVFLAGAKALHLDPSECVVFEDAEAGIEAAIRAGMKCIGIGEMQTLYKANSVIGGFSEMPTDQLIEMINKLFSANN